VRYLDRAGEPQELEADELLAVCIQHEVDHLDGVLFLDHLSRLKRRLAERAFKKNLPNYFKDLEEKKKKRAEGEKPKPEGAQPSAQEPG
jgi:peptide deformylase